jgi:hypothetical protein
MTRSTMSLPEPRLPDPTPTDLGWWGGRVWEDGVELACLSGLERFFVRTRNSTYEITVLAPRQGEVLVRGGQFFPEYTRVRLAGASLGGGCLKLHAIYPGFLMELVHEGQTIVTTRVQSITPADGPTPGPPAVTQ